MRNPRSNDDARIPCPICSRDLLEDFHGAEFISGYQGLVCRVCDRKAVNAEGATPEMFGFDGDGDNPVFIGSQKCWRRYRFGGFVTMLDPYDCDTLEEFYDRQSDSTRR